MVFWLNEQVPNFRGIENFTAHFNGTIDPKLPQNETKIHKLQIAEKETSLPTGSP